MATPTELRHELALLVLSRYPLVVIEGAEELRIEELAQRVAGDLGVPFLVWSATMGLARPGAGALPETIDPEGALTRVREMETSVVALFHDLAPYFDRPAVVRALRELERTGGRATVLLTGLALELPGELSALAVRVELALPDLAELERLVREVAAELTSRRSVEIAFEPAETSRIARSLLGLHASEARRLLHQVGLRDGRLDLADLPELVAGKRERVRSTGSLEWREPLEGLAQLGGAENLKRWAHRRREAFSDAARRFGLEPPRGLLLVGVPGTGKSLACRALAGEWGLPLLALDAGRLFDRYVGQSEANLRRALASAEAVAPAVLWIDEVEKAVAAGDGAGDGGLSQRLRGALLTWMQERRRPVFLMATANEVNRLPVEFLRRGRFDEVFFFDLPAARERERIFALHLGQRQRAPEAFDLAALGAASAGFSGAEIEGVVVSALYHAFNERVPLATDHLFAEIAATRPLAHLRAAEIAALRAWGASHAVPAGEATDP